MTAKQLTLGLIGLVILTGVVMVKSDISLQPNWLADHQPLKLQVGDQVLTVEIVNSPASITQGLSSRSELGSDGMLFIFDQPRAPEFWMRDMRFDLDLVWINAGQIVELTENLPQPSPGQVLSDLPRYSPHQSVEMVLEVPAGTVSQHAWQVGDRVQLLAP